MVGMEGSAVVAQVSSYLRDYSVGEGMTFVLIYLDIGLIFMCLGLIIL